MIKLYKRIFFITDSIYTTDTNLVCHSIEELLNSFVCDVDILCDGTDILFDVINYLTDYSISIVNTNADFSFHPLPKDIIHKNTITCIKGHFINTTKYDMLHQIGFIYNRHIIRMGVKLYG